MFTQDRRNALRAVYAAGDAAGLNPEGVEKVGPTRPPALVRGPVVRRERPGTDHRRDPAPRRRTHDSHRLRGPRGDEPGRTAWGPRSRIRWMKDERLGGQARRVCSSSARTFKATEPGRRRLPISLTRPFALGALRPRGTGWRSPRSRLPLLRPVLSPLPGDDVFDSDCAARFGSVAERERFASFENFEAVAAENHRPMDIENACIGEDFLRRGVSACPARRTNAGPRSVQLDLFGKAAVLHVGVRLRSRIDVDVDVLVVHPTNGI